MSDTATAVGSDHGAPEAAEAEKKKRKTEECVDAPASEGDAASKPTPDDVAVGQSTSEPVFGVFLFFFSLSLPLIVHRRWHVRSFNAAPVDLCTDGSLHTPRAARRL